MYDVYDTLDFLSRNDEANMIIDNFDRVTRGLNQQSCEDCISRKAVLDIDFTRIMLTTAKPIEMIEQKIKQLPPVTPQPKLGHWMFIKTIFDKHGSTAECSSSHKKWKTYDEIRFKKEHNFCPNCGAKMESEG